MQLLLQCRFLGNTPKIGNVILDVFSVTSYDSTRTPVKYSVSMGKVYLDEQLPAMDYFQPCESPKMIYKCMHEVRHVTSMFNYERRLFIMVTQNI